MSSSQRKIIVSPNPIETAAALFSSTALDAIGRRGWFITALSGGSTPKKLFLRLTEAPYREAIDWKKVIFIWGDERSVPPSHPDSNFAMANQALLAPLGIPSANIFRMEAERTDLDKAAGEYETRIRAKFLELGLEKRIDLVLLGMGTDGHTASLFPGTKALGEKAKWVVANEVPQLQSWRMTLTYPVINAARKVMFLVTGSDKAAMLKEVLSEREDSHELPSQAVLTQQGETIWISDPSAGALLGP